MAANRVAVFGASGRIGQAQVRQLVKQGFSAVAISRNKAVLSGDGFAGLEIASADLADCASVQRVLEGVGTVFFQLPSFGSPLDRIQYATNMIEAAKAGHPQ